MQPQQQTGKVILKIQVFLYFPIEFFNLIKVKLINKDPFPPVIINLVL